MQTTLYIRKRSLNEMLVLMALFISIGLAFLVEFLHLPSAVKYTIDVLWVMLLITIGINRFQMPNQETAKLLKIILIFWLITLVGFVLNFSKVVYYLWGFRNNFRFFVFFLSCAMFLKTQTADGILSAFDKLFYLHFLVCLFQFFILRKEPDLLGGIFGTGAGCNGDQIIFLSIITAQSLLRYMDEKKNIWDCLIKCGLSIVIAAMAELKFFYVLLVFIVAAASFMTSFSVKKLSLILLMGIGIYAGSALLVLIFPGWEDFFSLKKILASALSSKGYDGTGGVNRLTAIPIIWNRFLNTWPQKIFGLGLGNCETSTFSFLQTPFFERYGHLRYSWFSSAFMFLETGILGFGTYLAFFVSVFFQARKRLKAGRTSAASAHLSQIMALACMGIILYNSSMRIEEAYMAYFVLSLPFINTPQKCKTSKEEKICA